LALPVDGAAVRDVAAALINAGLCIVQLSVLESAAIHNALEHAGGNRTHAAHRLGISVRTLQRKIKREEEIF
jgi:transcriptional regulator with PAS, ATPase and Fis domain